MRRLLHAAIVALAVLGLAAPAAAAVTFSTISSAEGTASGTDMVTASTTPVSGDLYLLTVYFNGGGTATPTAVGTNGYNTTWTRIGVQALSGDGSQGLAVFHGYASSSVSGTITVTAVSSGWFYGYSLTRAAGAHASAAVVQSVMGTNTGGTSATVTLAAFGSATNATFFTAFCAADKVATYSAGSATIIDAQTVFFSVRSIFAQGEATSDTTPTGSWTGATDWIGIGIEVAEAGGGGGGAVQPRGTLTGILP